MLKILSNCHIKLKTATEGLKPHTAFCFDFQSFVKARLYKLDCKCMTELISYRYRDKAKDPR